MPVDLEIGMPVLALPSGHVLIAPSKMMDNVPIVQCVVCRNSKSRYVIAYCYFRRIYADVAVNFIYFTNNM